ncbi:MAG: exopolyphosphatase, partial [Desulfobacterales bacterium]|nr:exopolyphosphatase [Desulfobacterales bacterium]
KGTPAIQHWPALVANHHVCPHVVVGDETIPIEPLAGADIPTRPPAAPAAADANDRDRDGTALPFGRLFGSRSGDKGGNANLGVWARSEAGFAFLRQFLTVARLKNLLPDLAPYDVERYELPNLGALNFYIRGILGEGVAASLKSDPQAKTLGEYLRVKIIQVPPALEEEARPAPR